MNRSLRSEGEGEVNASRVRTLKKSPTRSRGGGVKPLKRIKQGGIPGNFDGYGETSTARRTGATGTSSTHKIRTYAQLRNPASLSIEIPESKATNQQKNDRSLFHDIFLKRHIVRPAGFIVPRLQSGNILLFNPFYRPGPLGHHLNAYFDLTAPIHNPRVESLPPLEMPDQSLFQAPCVRSADIQDSLRAGIADHINA